MSIRRNIFKKACPNNKLVVYVSRRDVFDDLENVDPIDGVAVIDPAYVGDRPVFARVQCEFRYGREDCDNVVDGVEFKKAFYLDKMQVYPRKEQGAIKHTQLQERLMAKLGPNACPFRFDLPHDIPSSVMLQPSTSENPEDQPFGVEYTLQVYVENDKKKSMRKHNSVKIIFRRLTTAYQSPSAAPHTRETSKSFHLHSGSIKLEATLAKEIFFHKEPIPVNIVIDNLSSNTIKRVKMQVIQMTEITLFKQQTFSAVVAEVETEYGFPISSGQTGWCQTFKLRPCLSDNRHLKGLALDGKLKHQDTNLASSTLIKDFRKKETMGLVVHYSIRVKVVTGFGGRDINLEIPFILTHQRRQEEKPAEDEEFIFEKFQRMKVEFPEGDVKTETA